MPKVRFSLARPTTKECNSRLRKHFGSWKRRCYNRLKECIMHGSSSLPAEKIPSGRPKLGHVDLSGRHVIEHTINRARKKKEDHLVRNF